MSIVPGAARSDYNDMGNVHCIAVPLDITLKKANYYDPTSCIALPFDNMFLGYERTVFTTSTLYEDTKMKIYIGADPHVTNDPLGILLENDIAVYDIGYPPFVSWYTESLTNPVFFPKNTWIMFEVDTRDIITENSSVMIYAIYNLFFRETIR